MIKGAMTTCSPDLGKTGKGVGMDPPLFMRRGHRASLHASLARAYFVVTSNCKGGNRVFSWVNMCQGNTFVIGEYRGTGWYAAISSIPYLEEVSM